jgi:hypothetical protein
MKLLALLFLFSSFTYANTGPRAITANEPAIDSSLETQNKNAKWEGRDPAAKHRADKKDKEERKKKKLKKANSRTITP